MGNIADKVRIKQDFKPDGYEFRDVTDEPEELTDHMDVYRHLYGAANWDDKTVIGADFGDAEARVVARHGTVTGRITCKFTAEQLFRQHAAGQKAMDEACQRLLDQGARQVGPDMFELTVDQVDSFIEEVVAEKKEALDDITE